MDRSFPTKPYSSQLKILSLLFPKVELVEFYLCTSVYVGGLYSVSTGFLLTGTPPPLLETTVHMYVCGSLCVT